MFSAVWLWPDARKPGALRQEVDALDVDEAVQLAMQAHDLARVDVAYVLSRLESTVWTPHVCLLAVQKRVWCTLWPAPLGE